MSAATETERKENYRFYLATLPLEDNRGHWVTETNPGRPGKMESCSIDEGCVPPELLGDPDWEAEPDKRFDRPWFLPEEIVFADLTGREIDSYGNYVRECSSEEEDELVLKDAKFTCPVDSDPTIRVFWK